MIPTKSSSFKIKQLLDFELDLADMPTEAIVLSVLEILEIKDFSIAFQDVSCTCVRTEQVMLYLHFKDNGLQLTGIDILRNLIQGSSPKQIQLKFEDNKLRIPRLVNGYLYIIEER